MPPDEQLVRIVEWPKDRALLDHRFEADAPAHVVLRSDEQPFQVEMAPTCPAWGSRGGGRSRQTLPASMDRSGP